MFRVVKNYLLGSDRPSYDINVEKKLYYYFLKNDTLNYNDIFYNNIHLG